MYKSKKRIIGRVVSFVLAIAVVLPLVSPINVCAAEETSQISRITVQEKMDQLLDKLGVTSGKTVYFTKNQGACNEADRELSHGCANCSNSAV